MRALALAVMLTGVAGPVAAAPLPDTCAPALASLATLTPDKAAAEAVQQALDKAVAALPNLAWAPGYCRAVSENFERKRLSKAEGVFFDAPRLIATGLNYEAFRVATFRSAGVTPKLFTGFIDQVGATAAYEAKLLALTAKVAPILNAQAAKLGLGVTVTPKEVAVTHMAEGGALLLTANFDKVDHVHPIIGIGLDDYRIGLVHYPGLVAELDTLFGTHLAELKGGPDDIMTFDETVLGTAVMYLYEKDLTQQKLTAEQRKPLAQRPLDEQFVVTSLVYNSGILFVEDRFQQILNFDTGTYITDVSQRSAPKRPLLPVMSPQDADAFLATGASLPNQPMSWNAVYHVLQRYGAWVALSRYTTTFTPSGDVAGVPPG